MIVDARELDPGFTLESDLCIIGGGVAGIAVASTLRDAGLSILLLESGGFEPERETQNLYRGEYAGGVPTLGDAYLSQSRLRYFGGSTNHWGGYCRPLEPIDFEQRAWVPHSGWPFSRGDLEPFYERAARFMKMPYFPDGSYPGSDRFAPTFDDEVIEGKLFVFNFQRFGRSYREEIVGAPSIRLVHHANAVEIVTSESGATTESVRVATLSGVEGRVRARAFVLATGGIENARLLLASDRHQKNGVGNDRDRVGRYFIDHPVARGGMGPMVVWNGISVERYQLRAFKSHLLFLSERTLREHKLLTVSLQMWERPGYALEGGFDTALARACFDVDQLGGPPSPFENPQVLKTTYAVEQQPNPESRVTLSGERDALGMRRVRLAWQLGGAELRTFSFFEERMREKVARLGYGRLKTPTAGEDRLDVLGWGNHHIGTTRMHADPTRGVVDANCRVHGNDNLYIAGSSVFPTSGAANPTFTLVALAVRLAEHVGAQLDTA